MKFENHFVLIIMLIIAPTAFTYASNVSDQGYVTGDFIKQTIITSLEKKGYSSEPVVNSDRKYKMCKKPLRVHPMFNKWSTIELICPDENGWATIIRTRASDLQYVSTSKKNEDKQKKIIVARKSLSKGHIISANDLEVDENGSHSGIGVFDNAADLIGRRVKTPITIGMSILARHLSLDWAMEKNDKISIVENKSAVQIIVDGNALENGQKGQKIRVKNLSSGKILFAWVVNEKKVSTTPNIIPQ